jgi:membrane protein implicated in regulation of membrane protease activity
MLLFWLIVAAVAAIGEVLTTGLFLATVAVAAVATALLSLVLPGGVPVQLGVFSGLSLAGIGGLRPLLVQTLGLETHIPDAEPMRHPYVVGRRAVVTRTVDSHGGQVRIGEAEYWSARAYDPAELMPVGATVEVMVVDGLTALVAPVVSLPAPDAETDVRTTINSDKGASA